MASATEPRPPVEIPLMEERLVDEQIRRTRRALKLVDLSAGMIMLVIGVMMFLLTAAVLDHWVIPGGWGTTGRVVLFVILMLGVAWTSWRVFWPLVRRPINPAFAAQAIEQSSPRMKNSLLNFLLLRKRKQEVSRQVLQAVQQQAAQRLSEVSLESVVDRSAILRLGYVLVAMVAICALYRLLSPKDLMASAGRVLLPWTNVAVPSRVHLRDIAPGDTQAARGEQIKISAEVLGLEEDEPVRLVYCTDDEQIVGQEVLMTAGAGGLQFGGKLPGRMSAGDGVQQDLTYWIEAGDARSQRYKITVFARPTLVVQNVRYDYPDYTGYSPREEAHTGDLRAVEGTVVTISALANQPIESGHVDFEADGRHDLLMKVEDQQATITFPLELRDDRRTPRYQSYVLRYITTEGRRNKLPPKYQIDVTPDYSPEIRILRPEEAMVDVKINESVTLEVEARDPDFALRNVSILGEVGGQQTLKENLLSKNHTGRFVGRMQLIPSKLGLKVGDILEYWGAAGDNRRPKTNLVFTEHRKIRIVGPSENGQQGSDKQGEGEKNDTGESQPGEEEQDESAEGDEGESENSEGESGAEGQQGEGQVGAGEQGEGMSDEESQQQEGQAGEGESGNDDDSQSNSDGQAGGDSEASQNENESSQNEGGEPSENQSAEEKDGSQEPVSPDGDDDGTAFDRIAEHFDEQDGEDAGENAGEDAGDQSEVNEKDGGESGQSQESDSEAADGTTDPDQSDHGTDSEGEDASDPSKSDEGAADSQDGTKPNEKEGEQSAGGEKGDQEAPAEGEGQTESDTPGSEGGDRTGGGQEGAGQQAEREGTGGAGEHQAADEGTGQATQPGEGEMSSQPGGGKKADGETGESSQNQPGDGSEQGTDSGDQPGGKTQNENGKTQQGATGEEQPSGQESSNQESNNGENFSSAAGQQPSGGGQGGESSAPPSGGEIQPGDKANLDYARKQTDLILNKLEDQLKEKEVDKTLLEKLGWSKDELRRFVDRWKNLKKQAEGETASAAAQQELDNALRSLGLGRDRQTGFRSQTAKDTLRDLQDSYRVKTPLEYQERVRAYVKGTATEEE